MKCLRSMEQPTVSQYRWKNMATHYFSVLLQVCFRKTFASEQKGSYMYMSGSTCNEVSAKATCRLTRKVSL